mmetsp:Transcript_21993/g.47168  ORF Transcript_21993/g.47168 Transcript_21993/m.47168 type:complete len:86 (+) Transcript_21993:1874-2131(+)
MAENAEMSAGKEEWEKEERIDKREKEKVNNGSIDHFNVCILAGIDVGRKCSSSVARNLFTSCPQRGSSAGLLHYSFPLTTPSDLS